MRYFAVILAKYTFVCSQLYEYVTLDVGVKNE